MGCEHIKLLSGGQGNIGTQEPQACYNTLPRTFLSAVSP